MTRTRIGYTIKKMINGQSVYAFKHGVIKRGGRLGLWQFETSRYRGKRVPVIFFTCPFCGEINKDCLSLRTILERVSRSHWQALRFCHNCRSCRKQIPYTLLNTPAEIQREYWKAVKRA